MAISGPWQGVNGNEIDVGPTILARKSKLAKALLAHDNAYLQKMAERWKFMKEGFFKYMCIPFLWCFALAGMVACIGGAIYFWFVESEHLYIALGVVLVPFVLGAFWAGTMALFDYACSNSNNNWDDRKKHWFFAYYIWGMMGMVGVLGAGSAFSAAMYLWFGRMTAPPMIGLGIVMVPFVLSLCIGLILWAWDLHDERGMDR
jgi:hypothetical protein